MTVKKKNCLFGDSKKRNTILETDVKNCQIRDSKKDKKKTLFWRVKKIVT